MGDVVAQVRRLTENGTAEIVLTGVDITSYGADLPGTALSQCSEEFRRHFAEADLILSKGMGNFECLSETNAPIFFLFVVKCTTVRAHLQARFPAIDLRIGSPVLLGGG